MLEILVAKFLIQGAVKMLIVKPAITATLSIIPQANFIHTSFLGKDIVLGSKDIIKFGMEKFYERFGEKKLKFKIDKLEKEYYRIVPQNDLARIFFKDYTDERELLVDLNTMDNYLNLLIKLGESKIDEEIDKIFSQDEVVLQTIYDMDKVISRSKNGTFGNAKADKKLVDEILKKNKKLVRENTRKRKKEIRRIANPRSVIDEVMNDFPNTPYQPISDDVLIDAILNKIQGVSKNSTIKNKILS